MKLRVEKEFIDKNTHEKHFVGEVIEVDEERANELLSDHRNLVKEEKKPSKRKKASE